MMAMLVLFYARLFFYYDYEFIKDRVILGSEFIYDSHL